MAKKSNNRLLYYLLGAVALLLIIVIVGKKAGFLGGSAATKVELAKAKPATIVEKVNASGTVQPVKEIKISPDVAGEIIELNVQEGDSVKKGDLLIKIKPDQWQSALDRAKANLKQQEANYIQAQASLSKAQAQFTKAKQDFARQQKLYDQKVISDADYESAKAAYQVAENDLKSAKQNVVASKYIVQSTRASVSEAQDNLSLTNVYAPESGTVSKLSVEKGERVVGTQQMAGTEMLRLANLNNMEVRVNVNENDIIRVSVGDTAVIDVDSYTYLDKKFKGVVTSIANTANDKASADAVTEFEVKIKILNSSYEDLVKEKHMTTPFRPGMTASVEIITNTKKGVLSVPLSAVTVREKKDSTSKRGETAALQDDNQEEVVFVNDDGKAKKVAVKTGISDFENIEITSGIKEGEEVVKGPFLVISKTLKDGDLIEKMGNNGKGNRKGPGNEK